MSDVEADIVRYYYQWFPPGVKRVIASGGYAWIGEVDDDTVLKYPKKEGEDIVRLEAEHKLLEAICPHPRVIQMKRYSVGKGLYLEYCPNGTVLQYLLESEKPPPSMLWRLAWCRETVEAVAHIHSKRVLHCDIQPNNLLLDASFHIKLADFQGRLLSANGETLADGWSGEPTRFRAPRDDLCDSDYKTDIFALGCTMYFIMLSHGVYPDIIDGEEDWRDKVAGRFAKQQWPQEEYPGSDIVLKCMKEEYESADEVLRDVAAVEELEKSRSEANGATGRGAT
jgi:serine/threonine protein kinase